MSCDLRLRSKYEITIEKLKQEYPQLFRGVGKLKNHQVKLHIDHNVKPVAQPHRRTPFHLQKLIEQEVETLLKEDITEPVNGPSEWLRVGFSHRHANQTK